MTSLANIVVIYDVVDGASWYTPDCSSQIEVEIATKRRETMATVMTESTYVLSDEMLGAFSPARPIYDRENRFFTEDFEELRDAGYLKMPAPKELGGWG